MRRTGLDSLEKMGGNVADVAEAAMREPKITLTAPNSRRYHLPEAGLCATLELKGWLPSSSRSCRALRPADLPRE
jgi:hypothetical protein